MKLKKIIFGTLGAVLVSETAFAQFNSITYFGNSGRARCSAIIPL